MYVICHFKSIEILFIYIGPFHHRTEKATLVLFTLSLTLGTGFILIRVGRHVIPANSCGTLSPNVFAEDGVGSALCNYRVLVTVCTVHSG